MNRKNLLPVDGETYLIPDLLDPSQGIEIFEVLSENIQWKQEPVKIMGKEIMQPRLTAWYGVEGKNYSI